MRRKKLIYLWIALGVVALLISVVQVGGMLLPVKHVATVSRTLNAPPERVWQALTGFESHKTWRKELQEIERTGQDPLGWREKTSFGTLNFEAEEFSPNRRLVARITDKNIPFGGSWTYDLEPTGEGTKLTITENGEVYSPAFRFMSKYLFGHTKTIETYLNQLEKHVAKGGN